MNRAMLIGNLCADPETRATQSGTSVVTATLATNEKYTDREGNKVDKAEFHRLVLWGRVGEILAQYCRKGSQIFIEGQIQTRKWEDKAGQTRYTTEINVRQIEMLGSARNSRESAPPTETRTQSDEPEDIPSDMNTRLPTDMGTRLPEPDDLPF